MHIHNKSRTLPPPVAVASKACEGVGSSPSTPSTGLRRESLPRFQRAGGQEVAEVFHACGGPRATDAEARAAGAPAGLRRGEGVARGFVAQRVRERNQSCRGFQVLQWYEPFRQIVVALPVRQHEATDVQDAAAFREDDLEKMRRYLWECVSIYAIDATS